MAPSFAAASPKASAPPVRMAVLYMANGVNTSMWTPEGQGREFVLSPTLAPLQDLKGSDPGSQQLVERRRRHR